MIALTDVVELDMTKGQMDTLYKSKEKREAFLRGALTDTVRGILRASIA